MACKINGNLLQEVKDFMNEVEFLDDYTVMFECQYAMAFGCQCKSMGSCDRYQACFDIQSSRDPR